MKHVEGKNLNLAGAPLSPAGELLLRGDVSACTLELYDLGSDSSTPVFTTTRYVTEDPDTTPDYTQCMFAAAQDDDNWPHAGSYSFWTRVQDSEYHLEGGHTYRAVATLTAGTAAPVWPQLNDYDSVILKWTVAVEPTP